MRPPRLPGSLRLSFCISLLLSNAQLSQAQVFINEIFFDPGGGGVEQRDEFIELRGAAGMSLDNHYLLFLENEDNSDHTGPAGTIDNIFNLSGVSLGSNGFLVIRQSGDNAGSGPSRYTVAPGATDLINTGSGPGYGSGATSSIGAEDLGMEGSIENGGFTAMLIRNVSGAAPVLGDDLDIGNDGLDIPTGQTGWEILDAIGTFEPFEAVYGRTYAKINYGREAIGELVFFDGGIRETDPGLEPDAEYYGLGFEIEYVGRWGNSVGHTDADWHVSNLTNDLGSGTIPQAQLPPDSPIDYRQSRDDPHAANDNNPDTPAPQPADLADLESNKQVPYGTRLLDNVGAPNFMFGDYNKDGVVDAADYTVWRDSVGTLGTESNHPAADANHDFRVDELDYQIWRDNYGAPHSATLLVELSSGESVTAPEPAALAGVLLLGVLGATRRSNVERSH